MTRKINNLKEERKDLATGQLKRKDRGKSLCPKVTLEEAMSTLNLTFRKDTVEPCTAFIG